MEHGGWRDLDGTNAVCAESEAGLGGCSGRLTLDEAAAYCEAVGARLCTADELGDNEAANTGCNLDGSRVWSSTVCYGDGGLVGHLSQAGSAESLASAPRTCNTDADMLAARCCADVAFYPPAPPLRLLESPNDAHVDSASCNNVSLRWTAPQGDYPADGFVVDWVADWERTSVAVRPKSGASHLSTVDPHATISGLQPGTGYVFWVAARNAAGMGAWSGGISGSTLAARIVPRAPSEPVLTRASATPGAPGSNCTTLRVQIPRSADGSACEAVLSLALQYQSVATRTWSVVKQHLLPGTEVDVDGLDPHTAYSFRLIAFNQAGGSPPSDVVGPFVVGMLPGFEQAQPLAHGTSSTTVHVDWSQLVGSCQGQLAWRVLYRLADSTTGIWKLLSAGHIGTSLRTELACPNGCIFKVSPLVSGFSASSAASEPAYTLPMRSAAAGAARLVLGLAATPDEVALTSQQLQSMESEAAALLEVPRQRVQVVETRPLANAWQVVFDLLPAEGGKAAAGAGVDGLAVTLASMLRAPESKLFLGDIMRHANATAGLRRLVPPTDGSSKYTTVAVLDSPAQPGSTLGTMGLGMVVAMLLAGIGALLYSKSQRQSHGYELPGGDSKMSEQYTIDDEEELIPAAPQPLDNGHSHNGRNGSSDASREVEYF